MLRLEVSWTDYDQGVFHDSISVWHLCRVRQQLSGSATTVVYLFCGSGLQFSDPRVMWFREYKFCGSGVSGGGSISAVPWLPT